ncbi:MAG TPA: hypothetical protein VFW20_02855 [Candidatus Limnocylindrales bacterium]|nr:hypothetical protein [Candidatus Limnocylindrales bacterium]
MTSQRRLSEWRQALALGVRFELAWAAATWLLVVLLAASVSLPAALAWVALPALVEVVVLALALMPVGVVEAASVTRLRRRSRSLAAAAVALFAALWALVAAILLAGSEVLGEPPGVLAVAAISTAALVAYESTFFAAARHVLGTTT